MLAWTLAEAKSKFSEVVDRAMKGEPQEVTRNGKPAVVIVSKEQWDRKNARRGTLLEFLHTISPHDDLEFPRIEGGVREVDLE